MTDNTVNKSIYGLLGKNISYSLSPAMHTAAFKHFGIENAEYNIFDINEDGLDAFLDDELLGRKINGINGINVTVPYKIKVKQFLDKDNNGSSDDLADRLGAVNTVSIKSGILKGYNTDGKGFYESFREETGIEELAPKKVFVLGAGGASRAICMYLAAAEMLAHKIFVFDIDKEKLDSLERVFESYFPSKTLVRVNEEDIAGRIAESGILINATPLGTREGDPMPVDPVFLHENLIIYDLVYARETELLKEARKRGLKAIGGLGMLVNQGALAFEIWTGKPFAEVKNVMKKAADSELKKRNCN